jgi:hypothetical protein
MAAEPVEKTIAIATLNILKFMVMLSSYAKCGVFNLPVT